MKVHELMSILERLNPEMDIVTAEYAEEKNSCYVGVFDYGISGVTIDNSTARLVIGSSSPVALEEMGHKYLECIDVENKHL